MPTNPFAQSEHIPRDIRVGVHQLVDRRDWGKYPGAEQAIRKELEDLLANEAWDCSKIISKEELLKSGGQLDLGRLMPILSLKHAESPELRKLKAWMVIPGDQTVDQDNHIAILQEPKVNLSGIIAISFKLSYGALPGNGSSQSDVARAYTQGLLRTQVSSAPTGVGTQRVRAHQRTSGTLAQGLARASRIGILLRR